MYAFGAGNALWRQGLFQHVRTHDNVVITSLARLSLYALVLNLLWTSSHGCLFARSFRSGNVAVVQLSSDTLSIEYQREGEGGGGGRSSNSIGGGLATATTGAAIEGGNSSTVEGEHVVRCDISIKGFHLQVPDLVRHII